MGRYRLGELLDMAMVQRLAAANFAAAGMPIGIIDAVDGSVLVGAGWQEICSKFHRVHPVTAARCRESDAHIQTQLPSAATCQYKCKNGLWDIAIPVVVEGEHLATLFLGQFLFEDERPDRERFERQARELGFDVEAYLTALDQVPVFKRATVDQILAYNRALASFLADLAERSLAHRRSTEALEESARRFQSMFDDANDALFLHEVGTGRLVDLNRRALEMFGLSAEWKLRGLPEKGVSREPHPLGPEAAQWIAKAETEGPQLFEWKARHHSGREFWTEVSIRRALVGRVDRVVVAARDIDERKRVEEERVQLERQLRQAQKMESVGLLAGGIAHDFNNLLSPILGYTDLLLSGAAPGEEGAKDLRSIRAAAERARDRVKQLLTLSQKQKLNLRVLELGELVREMERMLRRAIREDIRIEMLRPDAFCAVKADRGQLEQVLMNLAVNAQDAMPRGGVLTLELALVELDEGFARAHSGASAVPHVSLTVRDTGTGISKEVLERLFEPFFSTKGTGRGTGLGLSTAWGIVRQHGGVITVDSEVGRGSAFCILLPRTLEGAKVERRDDEDPLPRGSEVVLVAEDDESVGRLLQRMLASLGYRVVYAGLPERALALASDPGLKIDALLTDVVMPGLNGRQLHERLAQKRPGLKVLFMSGYANDVVVHRGVVDPEVWLLEKPFTLRALAVQLRKVLDQPARR
ncbi:MAG: PocR ligand-binding domain-containing protein [Deltaproteobacteria bacterium]|nr:PocR ligand-binding domain-containing protein [Deltaproteobacteria bacterium]